MVIGLKAVKYFILSISVFNQINSKKKTKVLNQQQLWLHFLEVAVASRKIAEYLKYELPEEAYVAGLLHDIGIVILENCFHEGYSNVVKLVNNGADLIEAETEVFGVNHQEVAEYVTTKWNMPKMLRDPLKHHHLKDEEGTESFSQLSKIIALADSIAQVPLDGLNSIYDSEKRLITLNILSDELGIDSKALINIHMRLAGEVVNSASVMDLDMGDAIEILTQSNSKLFNIYLELASLFKQRQEISRKIIVEQRTEGLLESLRISLATLSHYLNNTVMNIQGKCELMNMFYEKQDLKTLLSQMPNHLESMLKSAKKITLMLEELSEISSLDKLQFFNHSKGIDIEKSLKEKLDKQFEAVEKSYQ
jgi:HD superfamily phosphohydrolase YqeK